MSFSTMCSIFLSEYSSARHENACDHLVVSTEVSATRKSCSEESSKLKPLQPISVRNVTHSFIEIDTNDAHVRMVKEDTNGRLSSDINLNENKDEHVFQADGLIWKVHKVVDKKLAEDALKILSFTTLKTMDYQAYLQNVGSFKKVVEDKPKKCLGLDTH